MSYRYSYSVNYFLPGAFSRVVITTPLPDRIETYTPRRILDAAPDGCFGFSVVKTEISTTQDNETTTTQRLVRTYYVDAELLTQEDVLDYCGRDSIAYRSMTREKHEHMIRLFDGEIFPFNPVTTELLTA